jgi:hypothetical protein
MLGYILVCVVAQKVQSLRRMNKLCIYRKLHGRELDFDQVLMGQSRRKYKRFVVVHLEAWAD